MIHLLKTLTIQSHANHYKQQALCLLHLHILQYIEKLCANDKSWAIPISSPSFRHHLPQPISKSLAAASYCTTNPRFQNNFRFRYLKRFNKLSISEKFCVIYNNVAVD